MWYDPSIIPHVIDGKPVALYKTIQEAETRIVARKVDEHLWRFQDDIDNGFKVYA
jgi:hypothetical protein